MDPLTLIVIVALVGLLIFIVMRRNRRVTTERASVADTRAYLTAAFAAVKDPDTDPAVLRMYLAMENPHDGFFFQRLAVLRCLAQNPSLPVELQAAAINRIAQEESAAMMDRQLRKMAKSSPTAFIGFTTDF